MKFDLDTEADGVARLNIERFRGEFYKLSTANSNISFGQVPQVVNEGTTYFQGANTIRLSKKVNDWFFASGGYLFSKLNADSSVNMWMRRRCFNRSARAANHFGARLQRRQFEWPPLGRSMD